MTSLRKQFHQSRTKRYKDWLNQTAVCNDCGKVFFPMKESHYILTVCKPCLEAAPYMPYEGDHKSGGKDHRASLRHDGQEGDDYFG